MTISRVAYVVKVFPKLSETFIATELAELVRRGIEVRVLSLLPPTETRRHALIAQAGLDRLTCYQPAEFRAVLREFRPQLLHAHFATEPTAEARLLADELGLIFTFTAHGYDLRRKPPPDFAARAAAARAVVTVSQANARYIQETFGVPAPRVRVIPCGVDTERFRPAAPGTVRAEGTPLIVCVARQVPVKNLGLLLDTCAELRRRGVAFRCVQVGEGKSRQELLARRAELGLEQAVEMPSAADHDAVLAWWQRARVAALTSQSEGMPVCLMEAAACGVPAVSTAVGGVPELIEDNVTGLLAPPGDAGALADGLQRLLENPALAARLGTAARARVEERFSVRQQVDRLLQLWSAV